MQTENIKLKRNQKNNIRFIAHYLPQFHPIPENNSWWGEGFTEWYNVARAKPLFYNHYQPHIPTDLGFYDLRVPETRLMQAKMAEFYGIEGFIYWHYWFAGELLLEKPFEEVLKLKQPDFPFCLAWANHDWTDEWCRGGKKILKMQQYPGNDDHIQHFYYWLKAFEDDRYIRIDEKPLLFILKPKDIPDIRKITDLWRELALKEGLKGLHLIGYAWNDPFGDFNPEDFGFDATTFGHQSTIKNFLTQIQIENNKKNGLPIHVYKYEDCLKHLLYNKKFDFLSYPTVVPNWDNSPRMGEKGLILHDSTPELFRVHLKAAMERVSGFKPENKIIFIKSWNEWAEGNYIEPDERFSRQYLDVIKSEQEKVCR